LQVDVVSPLLLNAGLLLVLTTDYSDRQCRSLNLLTIGNDNDWVFWVHLTLRNVRFQNVCASFWHRWMG